LSGERGNPREGGDNGTLVGPERAMPPGPEKVLKNLRIFLPFPETAALESAASGKMDNIIEAKELQIERKHFYVELRENDRGKFLRITEEAHGRRNSIIVPSTGVDDFTAAISEVLTNNGSAPQ
jgi:PurA-like ssDNA and RNA-binding protein